MPQIKHRLLLFKKHQILFLILFFLALGVFFRSVNVVPRFEYAHDGDLYSWMVKDIVVNHHLRLIGQETSTQGIFIGPLFYYAIVPFFLIDNMDPISTVYFAVLLSIGTMLSFYYVFRKLFDQKTGLIALAIYAVFPSFVFIDDWVVPTITFRIWYIWYFYVVVMLTRGNFQVLPILGLLIGLIWHINFALAPALAAVPVAWVLAKKLPSLKQVGGCLLGVLIPSIPLILFEIKHHFSQTKSFIISLTTNQGGSTGFYKLQHVTDQVAGNLVNIYWYSTRTLFSISPFLILLSFLLVTAFLAYKKVLTKKELIVFYVWFFGIVGFFAVSSKIISEYYFTGLDALFIGMGICLMAFVLKRSKWGKWIVVAILLAESILTIDRLFVNPVYASKGYLARKQVAEFIAQDARSKGFPCVAVSYITIPGENVGFRYFFYLLNLHVNQPSSKSPDYTVVIPAHLYGIKPDFTAGDVGVIEPTKRFDQNQVKKSCSGQNANLTDPLFGYTQ